MLSGHLLFRWIVSGDTGYVEDADKIAVQHGRRSDEMVSLPRRANPFVGHTHR